MRRMGTVIQLQVQGERLKDHRPDSYDPRRITQVDALELTPDGAFGLWETGQRLQDVHHNHHHTSRSRGDNTLSICFTQQYERARERFGTPLPFGCMGENILIEGPAAFQPGLPAPALVFSTDGSADEAIVSLNRPAPPCRPFSAFASGASTPNELKLALQFFRDGGRGYYAQLKEPHSAMLHPGLEVYLLD
ncbi:MAG: hypothetical protein OXG02_07615 [Chloroflexi bacterium]|nr:hypothetical protein [Chloroflexota bacterium]